MLVNDTCVMVCGGVRFVCLCARAHLPLGSAGGSESQREERAAHGKGKGEAMGDGNPKGPSGLQANSSETDGMVTNHPTNTPSANAAKISTIFAHSACCSTMSAVPSTHGPDFYAEIHLCGKHSPSFLLLQVGVYLCVLGQDRIVPKISRVHIADIGTGFMSHGGNKGAVAARFEVMGITVCCLSSHLAAQTENVGRRNQDYKDIVTKVSSPRQPKSTSHYVRNPDCGACAESFSSVSHCPCPSSFDCPRALLKTPLPTSWTLGSSPPNCPCGSRTFLQATPPRPRRGGRRSTSPGRALWVRSEVCRRRA